MKTTSPPRAAAVPGAARWIDQVAVVRHRDRAVAGFRSRRAGRCAPNWSRWWNNACARWRNALAVGPGFGVEDLGHQPDIFMHAHGAPIRDGDPGRFLPAVLQGIQAKESHARHIFIRGKNPDHTAFFVGLIVIRSSSVKSFSNSCFSSGR